MTDFKGVTIIKKANMYFEGKVTSRSLIFPDGSRKTLGIMLPGEYEFNTEEREIMDITSGNLEVLLPEETDWRMVSDGQSFEVPAHSKFRVKVKSITDYCCSFVA